MHFDHTACIVEIRQNSPQVYVHALGKHYITHTTKNISLFCLPTRSRLHCLHDSYSLSLSAESLRGIYIQNRDYNEGNRYNRQLPSFAVFWCYNFHKIH